MPNKAFVSSTTKDLLKHRARAIGTLRKSGFIVDPMEDWTASTDEPREFSTERLDGCQLCVALIGLRRGYVPDGEQQSITQMELAEAEERGIDVLVFMLDEDTPWPHKYVEIDKDPDVRKWRERLAKRYGVEWFGLDPETLDVGPALNRWSQGKHKSQIQFDAQECIVAQPVLTQLHEQLGDENSLAVLSSLRSTIIKWLVSIGPETEIDPSAPPREVLATLHEQNLVDDVTTENLDFAITATSEVLYDKSVSVEEVSDAIGRAAIAFNNHASTQTDLPHLEARIDKSGGRYFCFSAGGMSLFRSSTYKSKGALMNGIRSARRIAAARPIEATEAKDGRHFFRLIAPNGEVIAVSMMFRNRGEVDAVIEEVRQLLPAAPLVLKSS